MLFYSQFFDFDEEPPKCGNPKDYKFDKCRIENSIEKCKEKTYYCKDQFFCVLNMLSRGAEMCIPYDLQQTCFSKCNHTKPCAKRTKCMLNCIQGVYYEDETTTINFTQLENQLDIEPETIFCLSFYCFALTTIILVVFDLLQNKCKRQEKTFDKKD